MEGSFRFRVAVVAAQGHEETQQPPASEGWELVRTRQTKDGVSTLLVYRRPA